DPVGEDHGLALEAPEVAQRLELAQGDDLGARAAHPRQWALGASGKSASSMSPHQIWMIVMWASWMRATVFEGTRTHRSAWSLSWPPPSPVSAMVMSPRALALAAALSTLAELPEVEIATAMSPGLAWASSWRAKTSS